MSKPRSRLIDYRTREFREVRGFTTEVHFGKQEKHLPGRPGFDPSRSTLTIGIEQAQWLLEAAAGTGRWYGPNKEVVDFGTEIGIYRGDRAGTPQLTTRGTIHYSKAGAHIVPARPTPTGGRRP